MSDPPSSTDRSAMSNSELKRKSSPVQAEEEADGKAQDVKRAKAGENGETDSKAAADGLNDAEFDAEEDYEGEESGEEESDEEGDEESDEEESDEEGEGDEEPLTAEEEQRQAAEFAAFASMSAVDIKGMMATEGPIVQVVVRVNGDVEQLEVDMSPRYDAVGTILGGKATFIGEYEKLQVVGMVLRDSEGAPENKYSMPAPMNRDTILGDVVLVRMDDDAEPQDFTLKEFQAFEASIITSPPSSSSSSSSSSSGK